MKRGAGIWSIWLLVSGGACSTAPDARQVTDAADQPSPRLTDAGADENEPDDGALDAGRAGDITADLHLLLIAALIETERSLTARCECLVQGGRYPSVAECDEAVSFGRDWVDCVNGLDLSGMDQADVRAGLHCTIEQTAQRGECLMGSSCNDEAVAACMTAGLDCPMVPLDLLSQLVTHCSIAFSH